MSTIHKAMAGADEMIDGGNKRKKPHCPTCEAVARVMASNGDFKMTTPLGNEIDRLKAEVARLQATVLELSEQRERLMRIIGIANQQAGDIAHTLGTALGYPQCGEYVCVDGHTPGSLAKEAARRLEARYEASQEASRDTTTELREEVKRLRTVLEPFALMADAVAEWSPKGVTHTTIDMPISDLYVARAALRESEQAKE